MSASQLFYLGWRADTRSLLRVYSCIIRTKLDYGTQIYASAKPDVLQKLDPVYNTALRLRTDAFKSSPVVSLYADVGKPPLSIRKETLALQHYVRMQRLPHSRAYEAVFNQRVVEPYQANPNISCSFWRMNGAYYFAGTSS